MQFNVLVDVDYSMNVEDASVGNNDSKQADNKSKGGKRNKRTSSALPSVDSSKEEEMESFPSTTLASKALVCSTRRSTMRFIQLPNTRKPSKKPLDSSNEEEVESFP